MSTSRRWFGRARREAGGGPLARAVPTATRSGGSQQGRPHSSLGGAFLNPPEAFRCHKSQGTEFRVLTAWQGRSTLGGSITNTDWRE